MTDDTLGPIGATNEADERIRELAELREEPSARFVGQVMDGINARQTSAQAIEMTWWGATKLVFELIESFLDAVGLRPNRPNGE